MLALKPESYIQLLDAERINLHEPREVSFWCGSFNCSKEQLQDAVAVAGASVADVREFLCR